MGRLIRDRIMSHGCIRICTGASALVEGPRIRANCICSCVTRSSQATLAVLIAGVRVALMHRILADTLVILQLYYGEVVIDVRESFGSVDRTSNRIHIRWSDSSLARITIHSTDLTLACSNMLSLFSTLTWSIFIVDGVLVSRSSAESCCGGKRNRGKVNPRTARKKKRPRHYALISYT